MLEYTCEILIAIHLIKFIFYSMHRSTRISSLVSLAIFILIVYFAGTFDKIEKVLLGAIL